MIKTKLKTLYFGKRYLSLEILKGKIFYNNMSRFIVQIV